MPNSATTLSKCSRNHSKRRSCFSTVDFLLPLPLNNFSISLASSAGVRETSKSLASIATIEAYSVAGEIGFGWWLVEHYLPYHVDCPDGCGLGEPTRGG